MNELGKQSHKQHACATVETADSNPIVNMKIISFPYFFKYISPSSSKYSHFLHPVLLPQILFLSKILLSIIFVNTGIFSHYQAFSDGFFRNHPSTHHSTIISPHQKKPRSIRPEAGGGDFMPHSDNNRRWPA